MQYRFGDIASGPGVRFRALSSTLRVQVPNNHKLTQNLYYNYHYPNPKYLIIGYMDSLGQTSPLSPLEGQDFAFRSLSCGPRCPPHDFLQISNPLIEAITQRVQVPNN